MSEPAEDREAVVIAWKADPGSEGAVDTSDDESTRTLRHGGEPARAWRAAKLLAAGLLLVWLVAWPIGMSWAATAQSGRLDLRLGYDLGVVLWALTSAALTLGAGYALSAGLRLEESAQALRVAADAFAGPLGPRGQAARGEIDALNTEIDRAIERLAAAESLIRQQVKAIDTAGAALTSGVVTSGERLATERQALIEAAEEMNREADVFASRIAERSEAAGKDGEALRERLAGAETSLDGQIARLEQVSARSLERFESLASTMEGHADVLAQQAEAQGDTAAKVTDNAEKLARAQTELAEQSQRLEALIRDQRKRADRLAKAVADQTGRLARLGAKPAEASARRGSWRDILSAVERSIPRGGKPAASEDDLRAAMDRLVERMHRFSLTLRTQLIGGPSPEDLARFEDGERLLFVRELLAGDQQGLRGSLKAEADRNAVFAQAVREFLGDFDALLEPVAGEPDGDAAMADYLRSPLGRLYVQVGTAMGRFGG